MKNIPVLIVGGGPVGLSLALALARQNVRSILIEKHPTRTVHPRARGVTTRTMELLNQWGNISELLKNELPVEAVRFIWAKSLLGEEVTRIEIKDKIDRFLSPIRASVISQDYVEEYLLQALKQHQQAQVEFSKEMLSFDQDPQGVTVRILDKKTNEEELIHTQYLIAADGAHSRIRKQLNIEMQGPDNLGRFCNVFCEFDIAKWTAHRPSIGFFFTDPKIANRSLFYFAKNRWAVGMRFTQENKKEDFTDEYCLSEIRRVLGLPDLKIKILSKSFWTMAAQVAEAYRIGNIFLAGDAAHRLPPTGGLGMNTGIQDAHNLAWKLAFVLNHNAPDTLLDTYFDERAPVAKRNIAWSSENAKRFVEIAEAIHARDDEKLKIKLEDQQKHLWHEGLDLGFIYHSQAIVSESEQDISQTPAHYVPTTLPGSRAPYVKLVQDGKSISTLDLFEKEYVLLVGEESGEWQKAANELIKKLDLPLKHYRIAKDGDLVDPENNWLETYEIERSGAVLVRPDGHVAWRSKTSLDNCRDRLEEVFADLLFRNCK